MFSCDHADSYNGIGHVSRHACDHPNGLGWWAALFFVVMVMLGALILPTILVGIISVAFDESTARVRNERHDRESCALLVQAINERMVVTEANATTSSETKTEDRAIDLKSINRPQSMKAGLNFVEAAETESKLDVEDGIRADTVECASYDFH